ncbi:MAG: leucine-rich repeat domain-containing protein [Eubacterium sp.]|nr:leucine-rich repeat domain-containing protein [Eubacterium sp.]
MKRKIKTLTAFIIAVIICMNTAVTAIAEGETSGTCGDGVTWSYDADTSTLTIAGSGRMSDYSSGEMPWYQYKSNIRNIQINEGVTYIGEHAFYHIRSNDDTKLTAISLPEGLTEIAAAAFGYCRIETLNLPSTLKTIQTSALNNMQELKSVTVAEGNPNFAAYNEGLYTADYKTLVFYPRASTVTDVVIKDGCEEIGINAFNGSGLDSVTIPSSVTVIGQSAFEGSSITSVEIPSSVKTIGISAFHSCASLTGVNLNEGLETVGATAFNACQRLSDISDVPKTVTSIGHLSFSAGYYLKNLTLLCENCSLPPVENGDLFSSGTTVSVIGGSTLEQYLKDVNHSRYIILCKDGTENHTFEKTSTTATCTAAGTATMTCSVCSTTKEEDEDALGHNFTNYVSDGNATCTADGTKTAECDNGCGETDTVTDEGSMTEHIYEETVIAPTCTEQGYTEYKCKDCSNTYKTDYIDALGHTPETVIVKEAQIGIAGLQQEKCSVCGTVLSETQIPALEEETTAEEETTEETTTAPPEPESTTAEKETATKAEEKDNSFKTEYSLFRVVGGIGCAKVAIKFDEEISGYEIFVSDGSGFKKSSGEISNQKENYFVFLDLKSDCNYQFKLNAFKTIDGKKVYADEESKTISVRIK